MKTSTAQDYPEPEYKSLDERRAQGKAPREALLGEVHRHLKPAKDRRDTKIRRFGCSQPRGNHGRRHPSILGL